MKVQGLLSAREPHLGGSGRFGRSLHRVLQLEKRVLLRYLRQVTGDKASKTRGQLLRDLAGRLISPAHVMKTSGLIGNPAVQVSDVGLKFFNLRDESLLFPNVPFPLRLQPYTSEQIARMLATNPVVVRRTMLGLKKAGFVNSEKGHGGGWKLSCDLRSVSLLDVHNAVGGPHIFAIGNSTDQPQCAVEHVVNTALNEALAQAEALLMKKLGTLSLADLAKDLDALCVSGLGSHQVTEISLEKSLRPVQHGKLKRF